MRLALLACVSIIGLFSPAAFAQNNDFFNRGGVGLFNPVIDIVNTGERLVVAPTVSGDRKYVTIAGTYQSAQLVSLQNFPFFGVVGGGPVGGGGAGGGGAAGGNGAGGQGNLQLPGVQVVGVDINASIPVTIKQPGPGPVLHQQGMIFIAPP